MKLIGNHLWSRTQTLLHTEQKKLCTSCYLLPLIFFRGIRLVSISHVSLKKQTQGHLQPPSCCKHQKYSQRRDPPLMDSLSVLPSSLFPPLLVKRLLVYHLAPYTRRVWVFRCQYLPLACWYVCVFFGWLQGPETLLHSIA